MSNNVKTIEKYVKIAEMVIPYFLNFAIFPLMSVNVATIVNSFLLLLILLPIFLFNKLQFISFKEPFLADY